MLLELKRHRNAYIFLSIGLAILAFLYIGAWPNLMAQRILAIVLGVFYFLWGVLTHVQSRVVTSKLIFEYLGVSVLASIFLYLLTV